MPKDDTSPATKKDIKMLMGAIGKLYDANERWKNEILIANEKWKTEIIREFRVVAENIRVDMRQIFKDRLEQHEDRILRLERPAGLATA